MVRRSRPQTGVDPDEEQGHVWAHQIGNADVAEGLELLSGEAHDGRR